MAKYYRDVDYFVNCIEFPAMGVLGCVAANSDGTANIFINSLYSAQKREEALKHELRHLALGHLWDDNKELDTKEAEADADDKSIRFGPGFSWVEVI